jgi:hypothetical protein
MAVKFPISIFKSLWCRRDDGQWAITGIKGLDLTTANDANKRFFVLRGEVQLMSSTPGGSIEDVMTSFGTPEFLMQQSIVPVVAWRDGDDAIRCIGTATIISCTGYLLTAAHVLMDPLEGGYGAVRAGGAWRHHGDLNFGVFIPFWAPGSGMNFRKGFRFFPFEKMWNWGEWKQSPLIHEDDRLEHTIDIAVCKIPEMPNGRAHQPLNMSLNPFIVGEDAYALGYAEMQDIPMDPANGCVPADAFRMDLHVSIGNIVTTFPHNHVERNVPTPGPCFDFDARIPGKMSGAPIFGARGAVIRGIVSRSFSGEDHAYGSMLGPAMDLPLNEYKIGGKSLHDLLEEGSEGMTKVIGAGL